MALSRLPAEWVSIFNASTASSSWATSSVAGRPPRDRVLASMLGAESVDALLDGYDCHMVGSSAGKMVRLPLPEAWEGSKEISPSVIDLIRVLAS